MSRGRGRGSVQNRTSPDVLVSYSSRTSMAPTPPAQDVNNDPSSPLSNHSGAAVSNGSDPCGTCNIQTRMDAIGCDHCETWFHPSSMCLGLPDQIVNNIIEYEGQGIAFICTECRSKSSKSGSVPDSAFKQLFQTVQTLSARQDSNSSVQDAQTTLYRPDPLSRTSQPSSFASDRDNLRTIIREETRELEERNKRKSSIIIRGLEAQSTALASAAFDPVSTHILGSPVALSDVTCINRDKKLYRAKIIDDETRKNLLDNAKKLHNTQYSHIYVSRDLTYNQRKELWERCAQRTATRDGETGRYGHPYHPGSTDSTSSQVLQPSSANPPSANGDPSTPHHTTANIHSAPLNH